MSTLFHFLVKATCTYTLSVFLLKEIFKPVLVEITNKMQPCIRIYYSTVHWRLNMFRAAYRSSSRTLTVFVASVFHTHVVTGRSQVWLGCVNQRLQIQLELLMMSVMPLETCLAFN